MRNYKIVACDLDGTLLNNRSEVSSENLSAIEALFKKGVYFVPSTGRTFSELPIELKSNPNIRYAILSNGAVVFDKHTGKRILNGISKKDAKEIFEILIKHEAHITFRRNGECFVDAAFQTDDFFEYYNLCEAHRAVVRNYANYLEDFGENICSEDGIEVIQAFFHSYEGKKACQKILCENKNLRIAEPFPTSLEIFSCTAGKGNALRSLADLLCVDCADTISIGDSDNDSSIIEASGFGLAVANATDNLKSLADEVICSNEEHAVAYVLSHYFS